MFSNTAFLTDCQNELIGLVRQPLVVFEGHASIQGFFCFVAVGFIFPRGVVRREPANVKMTRSPERFGNMRETNNTGILQIITAARRRIKNWKRPLGAALRLDRAERLVTAHRCYWWQRPVAICRAWVCNALGGSAPLPQQR